MRWAEAGVPGRGGTGKQAHRNDSFRMGTAGMSDKGHTDWHAVSEWTLADKQAVNQPRWRQLSYC